jgi:hypothetical protein
LKPVLKLKPVKAAFPLVLSKVCWNRACEQSFHSVKDQTRMFADWKMEMIASALSLLVMSTLRKTHIKVRSSWLGGGGKSVYCIFGIHLTYISTTFALLHCMAATCIAENVGKNCFIGQLSVALFSNGPVSNATLAHILKVIGGLLEGNDGQALGLESVTVDDGLINDVNSESTESDVGSGQHTSKTSQGSKKSLSAGIKAMITLLCLVVVGLVVVVAIRHFGRPVTKHVPDEDNDEGEIHDPMAVTVDQHDEIYGA